MRLLADGAVLLAMANEEALAMAAALSDARPPGFLDAVPGAETLLVLFEPGTFDLSVLSRPVAARERVSRTVKLEAVYDGPDLAELGPGAARRHAEAEHIVRFLGFAPGFAYMTGGLDVPRLATPRTRVPAGSLAVADGYTGVYPAETPGGWRLIGQVGEPMFDADASPPALLRPGDRVVFEPVGALPERRSPRARAIHRPVLRVLAPGPFTSVQGAPRYGLASSGVPAGGAIDPRALADANDLLGNPPLAAGLEFTIMGPEMEALASIRLAFNGAVHELRAGDRVKIGMLRDAARGYVAVEGGLAPELLTRPLNGGAELSRAVTPEPARKPPRREGNLLELRAVAGPQLDRFRDPHAFFRNDYTLSPQSDRRGFRLRGPKLDVIKPDIPPEGTALGAVQVPGDGLPIVLGPDRPVTGGYAKIATVIAADLPLLAQARPGARVRFREVRP